MAKINHNSPLTQPSQEPNVGSTRSGNFTGHSVTPHEGQNQLSDQSNLANNTELSERTISSNLHTVVIQLAQAGEWGGVETAVEQFTGDDSELLELLEDLHNAGVEPPESLQKIIFRTLCQSDASSKAQWLMSDLPNSPLDQIDTLEAFLQKSDEPNSPMQLIAQRVVSDVSEKMQRTIPEGDQELLSVIRQMQQDIETRIVATEQVALKMNPSPEVHQAISEHRNQRRIESTHLRDLVNAQQ